MKPMVERTPEIEDIICEGLAEGITLSDICRLQNMPTRRAVYMWTADDADLAARIARARVTGGGAIAERMRLTARGVTAENGGDSSGDVQRDKLIIDTDLKLLAKWFPKDYGDRQQVAPTDIDGENIQLPSIMFVPVAAKPMADD